jgi:ribosome biogenesis GTPase A
LIEFLQENYEGTLKERFGVEESQKAADILIEIAKNRNCIKKGNEIDYSKAANLVLDEYRSGALGRISVEIAKSYE